MDREALRAKLAATLADGRLSRGERSALKELFGDAAGAGDPSPTLRGVLRQDAFAVAGAALAEVAGGSSARVGSILAWLEGAMGALDAAGGGASDTAELPTVHCFFSPSEDCRHAIQRCLEETRRRADLCVFTITDDAISDAIVAATRRGARIRLITDDDKQYDRGADIDRLARAGVRVAVDRTEAHMHHKFALFDEERLLTGSYNWTRSAWRENHENLLLTDDARAVTAYAAEFDRLWSAFAGD